MISFLQSVALISAISLLAIWVGYPLAIAAVATMRRSTVATAGTGASVPAVSVVLATREVAPLVIDRVKNLIRADFPADRLEIIVAYDPNQPGIDFSEAEFDGFNIRSVPGDEAGGKAAGLNAGVRSASGEIIVFADTRQHYDPGTIACLVAPFDRPGIGAVTGNYQLAPGGRSLVGFYWTFEKWLRRKEAAVRSSVGATGAVWAIRRSLWQPLPSGLILDDVWSPMRVALSGYLVIVSDCALALETRRPAPRREYARKVRTLTGVIQLCAWMPAVLVPFRNPLWIQFVFHKLLRLLTPILLIAPGLWVAAAVVLRMSMPFRIATAVAFVGASSWIALSRGRIGSRLRGLVAEAVLMLVAVVVAVYNGLRRNWGVWD